MVLRAAFVKVGVGALHRGIGNTKQNPNKEVVDRREIDGKKIERKQRLKK